MKKERGSAEFRNKPLRDGKNAPERPFDDPMWNAHDGLLERETGSLRTSVFVWIE
jgi:hypothetical protein